MKIKSIKQFKNLQNRTVFLRVDFNVPMKKGKILDSLKMRESLETINYLMDRDCKIIIATHLGRPEGKRVAEFSVKPLAVLLGKVLERSIKVIDITGNKNLLAAREIIKKLKPGSIVFLENLRFNPEEQAGDEKFAKNLAALAEVYVNDAFAVCHRNDASVAAIKKFIPAYAGILLENEITNLNKVLKPEKPLVAIVGGVKVETKTNLLNKIAPIASKILIGGALANNFFVAQGYKLGLSKIDSESVKLAKGILKKLGDKLVLPTDLITVSNFMGGKLTKKSKVTVRRPNNVGADEMVVDIGPETISNYAALIKTAKTIVWNGPLGLFEIPRFKNGTVIIARVIATQSGGKAYGVVGGGETVEALNLTKMDEHVNWVSTGGGAMLSYLGGEKMPGLESIVN
jgi:phosphoglycerate kinase